MKIVSNEEHLVASGAMLVPEEEINWDAFFNDLATADLDTATVTCEAAIQAVIDSRGDR